MTRITREVFERDSERLQGGVYIIFMEQGVNTYYAYEDQR
jgi:hypothetical protein